MASSLKLNFVLNVIRTFSSIAFPVITFAYVSRILDVQGIGMFDYARSIVSYFSLIAQLGVATYGMREIPKVKHDKDKLSKLVAELFSFNLIATVVAYVLFFTTLFGVDKFEHYRALLLINGLSIGFCALGLEWLYGALEEYKYITIRTLVFQVLSFVFLLIFVHEKTDIYIYAAINVFSSVGSNIFNFVHARRYLQRPILKISNILKHTSSIFIFWGNNIAATLYLLVATTMLGYLCDEYAVGIYSASNKICRIFVSLVVSICPILLSRSSAYISDNRSTAYEDLSKRAFDCICFMSVPIAVFLFSYSKEIVLLFSGATFLPAVSLSKIMSILMVIIPASTFLSMQILIPYKRESDILIVLFIATIFNAVLSMAFIPKYAYYAAGIINIATELLILVAYIIISRKKISLGHVTGSSWHYVVGGLLQMSVIYIFYNREADEIDIANVLFTGILGIIIYFGSLILFKDDFFCYIIKTIKI